MILACDSDTNYKRFTMEEVEEVSRSPEPTATFKSIKNSDPTLDEFTTTLKITDYLSIKLLNGTTYIYGFDRSHDLSEDDTRNLISYVANGCIKERDLSLTRGRISDKSVWYDLIPLMDQYGRSMDNLSNSSIILFAPEDYSIDRRRVMMDYARRIMKVVFNHATLEDGEFPELPGLDVDVEDLAEFVLVGGSVSVSIPKFMQALADPDCLEEMFANSRTVTHKQ